MYIAVGVTFIWPHLYQSSFTVHSVLLTADNCTVGLPH